VARNSLNAKLSNSIQLQSYILGLPDFKLEQSTDVQYRHMGATITDAILQSGLKFETVVRPRIEHVLKSYPDKTTSGFLLVLRMNGPEKVLRWKNAEKPSRVLKVTEFLSKENVESEADLARWLSDPENVERLRHLRGIGPKTIDYFRLLCGVSTTAIDRHITRFLENAGIVGNTYSDAHSIVSDAAKLLGVSASVLDHSIWTYMTETVVSSEGSRNAR
jgi:hypothetical protein